jgi:2',3'-cyclic-nucleotide 2'-phosphodiesterase (5'-nucleotidase family)
MASGNLPTPAPGIAGQENELSILYTGSLNGALVGCSCKPAKPGLAKVAYFINSFRNRENNVVLVDAGDLLINWNTPESYARYIFQAYQYLNYDMVGMGEAEFASGLAPVLEYQKMVPLRADNGYIKLNNRILPLSTPPKIFMKGKYRVGIFATLEPESDLFRYFPKDIKEGIKMDPVEFIASKIIKTLRREKADVVIWLYHGFMDHAKILAKKIPGADVMVVVHEGRVMAERLGKTMIVSPGGFGIRIGILQLTFSQNRIVKRNNRFQELDYENDPDDPEVLEMVRAYYRTLNQEYPGTPTDAK